MTSSPHWRPPTRRRSPPTGTPSGWSAATRPSRCRRCWSRSTRCRRPSTRRSAGAQLLVTHHPLLLRGVHGVGADTPKGALLHRLIRGGTALFTAHTNADSADPGVSDALAAAIGLDVHGPLVATPAEPLDKIVTFVPVGPVDHRGARRAVGGGRRPDRRLQPLLVRDRRHRPVQAAERCAPDDRGGRQAGAGGRDQAGDGAAARRAGPRSSPRCARRTRTRSRRSTCFELAELPSSRGPRPDRHAARARAAVARSPSGCAAALPATAWGVRAAGDPDRPIRTVAVCGGAGDSALGAATAPASTPTSPPTCATTRPPSTCWPAQSAGATPALVDVAHWASEWPWCAQAADVVRAALGGSVEVRVSTRRTDPWTVGAEPPGGPRSESRPRRPAQAARPRRGRRRAVPARPPPPHAARARRADRGRGGGARRPRTSWSRSRPPPATSTATSAASNATSRACGPAPTRDNQMLAGAGIGAKQATDLQHELETLARRQGVLEDEQLEVMEQREAVGADVEHSRVVLAARRAGAHRRHRAPRHRARRHRRRRGRPHGGPATRSSPTLPADLLAAYERRREQRGVGAAPLRARRCQACRLELDRTAIARAAGRARRRDRALRGVRRDPGAHGGVGPVKVIVEADGGSRGNPGPAGYGAVVLDAVTERGAGRAGRGVRRHHQQRRRVPGPDRRAAGRASSSAPPTSTCGWTPSSSSSRCPGAGRSSTRRCSRSRGGSRARPRDRLGAASSGSRGCATRAPTRWPTRRWTRRPRRRDRCGPIGVLDRPDRRRRPGCCCCGTGRPSCRCSAATPGTATRS